ncbi:MAG: bifunctional oligoribonuclease/PAP phosphatase NrnA [Clostridia bacterium]
MNQIAKAILSSKKVALFTHVSPDADGLGCLCALFFVLKKLNISAKMFCDLKVPPKYDHLANINEISSDDIAEKYDLYLSMDSASADRIGKYSTDFLKAENSVVIDHHPTNTLFGKINYVEPQSASCCEIIYDLIKILGVEIDSNIASALFGGIFSDTGGFCNGNTTPRSLAVASKIAEFCPNFKEITYSLFKKRSQKEFLLWKKSMADSTFVLNNKVCLSCIRKSTLVELGANEQDTSFIINVNGMVEGVLINIFICESDNNIYKVSFRSLPYIDVGSIAKNLGGGGHKNASGCSLVGGYKNILAKIFNECEKEINKWK